VGDIFEMINEHETVSALLARDPQAARILLNHRMHCVGCAIAPFETLAEVCLVYGVPLEPLLEELRQGSGAEPSGEQ
jgi:hybrid cluster-associated redox disulfide protein